jgi:hypothetical protein
VNVKEMTMRAEERPTLVQRWIIVPGPGGTERLEARWIVEGETRAPASHAAA